jgi:hypothetical protein
MAAAQEWRVYLRQEQDRGANHNIVIRAGVGIQKAAALYP